MSSQSVLILTSNTGGGHRSAANALENSLTIQSAGELLIKMTQVLEESHLFSRKAADLYNFLLRDHQNLMKYYFWLINNVRLHESKFLFKSALGYGVKLFDKMVPNVIVSVHPMTQHFFAHVLRKLNLQDRIPLLTVVTDPYRGFWKGWACDDVSQYYVASDSARQQLIEFGVPDYKIQISGMPVHSSFQPATPLEKRILRHELELSPEKFTVFLNAGWVGGGNISGIYESLIQGSQNGDLPIQVIFLAGCNEALRYQAEQMAQSAPFDVRVLGSTDKMPTLMRASDVLVSKLGGLTSFEALSCRLPIIADGTTLPMPQELDTVRELTRTGAAIELGHPDQIVSVIQSLVSSPNRYHSLLSAADSHGKPGASDRIARDVLRYIEPSSWGKN
jgi:UDP-N-acetylglucosamine:LPS N-acetylglucosamine transferase